MGGEPVDHELLEHVGDGTEASTDGGALEDEGCSGAIGSGVVGVGDTTGGEASEDGGVVELPVVVVSPLQMMALAMAKRMREWMLPVPL